MVAAVWQLPWNRRRQGELLTAARPPSAVRQLLEEVSWSLALPPVRQGRLSGSRRCTTLQVPDGTHRSPWRNTTSCCLLDPRPVTVTLRAHAIVEAATASTDGMPLLNEHLVHNDSTTKPRVPRITDFS
jgi:hypothetical protein